MADLVISPAANMKGKERTAANFLLWPLPPAGISYKLWFMKEFDNKLLPDRFSWEKESDTLDSQ